MFDWFGRGFLETRSLFLVSDSLETFNVRRLPVVVEVAVGCCFGWPFVVGRRSSGLVVLAVVAGNCV